MLILSAGAMRTTLDWSLLRLGVAAVLVAGACSPAGTSGPGGDGGTNGGDGSEPTTPDGFVSATVGTGTQSALCPVGSTMPWVTVGEATTGKPATVLSGNDGVTMTCSVRTSGNGYDVSVSVTATGSQGGSFTLVSPPGMGAVTVSGGQGIQASFGSTPGSATYHESDCVLSFTYLGAPIPDSPSVFPGRIWGHLSCPAAQTASNATTCDAEADFLFETCQD
jgi:hypothetical protein